MAEPAQERVLTGAAASPGLADGPAHRRRIQTDVGHRAAGTPEEEAADLKRALEAAQAELDALMAGGDDLAAEILEFQHALLEDDDLLDPVREAIAAGEACDAAWSSVLDGEITDYAAADDDYMAARADDLRDLKARVLDALSGTDANGGDGPPDGAILVAEELTPSAFLQADWTRLRGAAIGGGSPTSHVSILARARGVPMVVGLGTDLDGVHDGMPALLDGQSGSLTVAPSEAARRSFATKTEAAGRDAAAAAEALGQPAITRSGTSVRVLINVDDPAILEDLDPEHCDGIGLTRTEFLFSGERRPDEDEQARIYGRIIDWAGGRPVTIRTLDAGGDKPIPGITVDDETNPFLGLRGIRLSLARSELFSVQLRALARAAARGPLKIMLPMVSTTDEVAKARSLLDAAVDALSEAGIEHARPDLGIMVETPAAALIATDFEADFYSIGSNDLIQYTLAAARDNPAVAYLADPRHPAVLGLIRSVIDAGCSRDVEVSLCGDMASTPDLADTLLGLGLRTFSCAPAQVGPVKRAINASAH